MCSGEEVFQFENQPKQNEQCLKQFDLGEYREVLSDLAVWLLDFIMKFIRNDLPQSLISMRFLCSTRFDSARLC